MTRKDYILIARALQNAEYYTNKQLQQKLGVRLTTRMLIEQLERDNKRFDADHFLAVVRGEKALESRPQRKRR